MVWNSAELRWGERFGVAVICTVMELLMGVLSGLLSFKLLPIPAAGVVLVLKQQWGTVPMLSLWLEKESLRICRYLL
jgi:hypothetical protein